MDLKERLENVYQKTNNFPAICIEEIKKIFITDYFSRLYDTLGELLDNSLEIPQELRTSGNIDLHKSIFDVFIELLSDDPLVEEIKKTAIPNIEECFYRLSVSTEKIELFKNIVFWTLSWMRDDEESIETWLAEVPNHLKNQLTEHYLLHTKIINEWRVIVETDKSYYVSKSAAQYSHYCDMHDLRQAV